MPANENEKKSKETRKGSVSGALASIRKITSKGEYDAVQVKPEELGGKYKNLYEGWVKQLGNYNVAHPYLKEDKTDSNGNTTKVATKMSAVQTEEMVSELLGNEGFQRLHETSTPSGEGAPKDPCAARKALLLEMACALQKYEMSNGKPSKENFQNTGISLKELFDKLEIKNGEALFQAAIEEEQKSKEFRNAVVAKSAVFFPGRKWKDRLILWVGGPSASGKTFSAKNIIAKVAKELLQVLDKNPHSPPKSSADGNFAVFIDGGVEREISQVRDIFKVAVYLGYDSVSDLHKNTKGLKTKKLVDAAVSKNNMLSKVIPATFTADKMKKMAFMSTAKDKMAEYAKDINTVQVFSRITHNPDERIQKMQNTTNTMGTLRSTMQDASKVGDLAMIADLNGEQPCESKEYESEHFLDGVNATKTFQKEFEDAAKKDDPNGPLMLDCINDLMYVTQVSQNKWDEYEHDKHKKENLKPIMTTRRAYAKWIAEVNENPETNRNFEQWNKLHRGEEALWGAIINENYNYVLLKEKRQLEQSKVTFDTEHLPTTRSQRAVEPPTADPSTAESLKAMDSDDVPSVTMEVSFAKKPLQKTSTQRKTLIKSNISVEGQFIAKRGLLENYLKTQGLKGELSDGKNSHGGLVETKFTPESGAQDAVMLAYSMQGDQVTISLRGNNEEIIQACYNGLIGQTKPEDITLRVDAKSEADAEAKIKAFSSLPNDKLKAKITLPDGTAVQMQSAANTPSTRKRTTKSRR